MARLIIKRIFDFIFALIGLILFLPLIILLGLLVKLETSGPMFYRGIRIGKDDEPFKIWKLRTLIQNADLYGEFVLADDIRLTKMGRFLRKWKLDELPQLINVLKGEMSLVGPRPDLMAYTIMLPDKEFEKIYSIKPGMTDLASLWAIHEEEMLNSDNPEQIYIEKIRPKKIKLQLEYIENQSLWLDIKIIWKTILRILGI